MRRLRKWLFSRAEGVSLQERMFLLAGLVAFIAMMAAFFISFFTQGFWNASGTLGGAVLLAVVISICYRTKHIYIGAAIIVILSVGVLFPFAYFLGGGAYSASPVWFVIIAAFCFMIFRGWALVAVLGFANTAFGITTYVSMKYPEWVRPLSGEYDIYSDTFLGTIIVAFIVGLLMYYQARLFENENKVVQKQVREITDLTESQNHFFAAMSHEIRTPINTIIGLNEMILRDRQISQEVTENALNIQNASRVLLALINDILDMSKIESERMEITPSQYETSHMLSEIVNLLWARAKEKNLDFDVHVGDNVPSMLYGDEMRIKQVIINLVSNAIKYTKEGGVTLSVDGERNGANDFMLRIEVEDTGIGIRQENLEYIFDAFKRVDAQTNKAIEGTGLGLAISKQLTELMGGTIRVNSIYTKGSTFRAEIPQQIVSDEPMKFTNVITDGSRAEAYHQIFEAPDARVLIVDDNDLNRMVTRKLLRETQVKIDLAASGAECLEKTRETRYDVIFMDHEMPEMSGIEALERIRTQVNGLCKTTPVIALTANAGSDMNEFYASHGFAAYLAKPIHGSLLEATLARHLPRELIENMSETQDAVSLQVSRSRKKRPILITAENVCDLPAETAKAYDIRQIPYYVVTEKGRFRDMVEVGTTNVLNYLGEGGEIKTEAASVEEYEAFFGEVLTDADCVVHLSCSQTLSQGFAHASQASKSFSNVHVIDTAQLSSGIGMVALRATELVRDSEISVKELIAKIPEISKRTQMNFLVPTLSTMQKNRRASGSLRIFEEVFHMIPAFCVKGGRIRFRSLHSNFAGGAPEKFVHSVLRNKNRIDRKRLIVPYAGCSSSELASVKAEIEKLVDFEEILFTPASATISSNCGLYAIGLCFEFAQRH